MERLKKVNEALGRLYFAEASADEKKNKMWQLKI